MHFKDICCWPKCFYIVPICASILTMLTCQVKIKIILLYSLQPNKWNSWSKKSTSIYWPAVASTCAVWPARTSTTWPSPSTRPLPRCSRRINSPSCCSAQETLMFVNCRFYWSVTSTPTQAAHLHRSLWLSMLNKIKYALQDPDFQIVLHFCFL